MARKMYWHRTIETRVQTSVQMLRPYWRELNVLKFRTKAVKEIVVVIIPQNNVNLLEYIYF